MHSDKLSEPLFVIKLSTFFTFYFNWHMSFSYARFPLFESIVSIPHCHGKKYHFVLFNSFVHKTQNYVVEFFAF